MRKLQLSHWLMPVAARLGTALLLCAAIPSHSVETRVLDLPLGGKPKIAKRCGDTVLAVKNLCWIDSPYRHPTGRVSGSALAPLSAKRPNWAAYVTYEFTLARDGTLEEIKVIGPTYEMRGEIATSIRSRYGFPFQVTNVSDGHHARWISKDSAAELFCYLEGGCKVTFRTPEAEAARLEELAERDRATKARPVAP